MRAVLCIFAAVATSVACSKSRPAAAPRTPLAPPAYAPAVASSPEPGLADAEANASLPARPSGETITDLFPLAVGTCYVYAATVSWQNGDRVESKDVTWKMEVVEETPPYFSGEVVGFRMKGHPMDLAWYSEDKTPSDYAIIRVGLNRYYKTDVKALERLSKQGDGWHGLVSENQLFLDLPLHAGKRLGATAQICRNDNRYYWSVGAARPVTHAIAGVAPGQIVREYSVAMVTGPDRVEMRFAPGIGITGYKYGHHGTVSSADVRLIEFRRGTPTDTSRPTYGLKRTRPGTPRAARSDRE